MGFENSGCSTYVIRYSIIE